MLHSWKKWLVVSIALVSPVAAWGTARAQTSEFQLSASGPGSISGVPGLIATEQFLCVLEHGGTGSGAQGWSFGVDARDAQITDITIAGTDAEALLNPDPAFHFVVAELTSGLGNEGAVMSVVLDSLNGTTLPTNVVSSVAAIEVSATIPTSGGVTVIRFRDGLQGTGQPTPCAVLQDGLTVTPQRTMKIVELLPILETTFELAFSGPASLSGPVGESVTGDYFLTLTHTGPGEGAQGYELGFTADGGAITDVTIAGTDAEALLNPDPALHFVYLELTSGPGNEGAVMAVVFDFFSQPTLPTNATATVGRAELTATIPAAVGVVKLKYVEGLQGSGQPVSCVANQGGHAVPMEKLPFGLQLVPGAAQSDTDGDGIPDDDDQCPQSDLRATVFVVDCDSGVENHVLPTGCTINDLVAQAASNASSPEDFAYRVLLIMKYLVQNDVLTRAEATLILGCLNAP